MIAAALGLAVLGQVAIPFGFFYFEESDSYGFQLPEYGKNTAKGAKYALLFLAAPLAVFFLAALSQYGESASAPPPYPREPPV